MSSEIVRFRSDILERSLRSSSRSDFYRMFFEIRPRPSKFSSLSRFNRELKNWQREKMRLIVLNIR